MWVCVGDIHSILTSIAASDWSEVDGCLAVHGVSCVCRPGTFEERSALAVPLDDCVITVLAHEGHGEAFIRVGREVNLVVGWNWPDTYNLRSRCSDICILIVTR